MDAGARVAFAIEAGLNFAISGLLNALCAWLLYGAAPFVPVDFWSLLIDTTITCYLVSVCTAFFATRSARRYRRQGLHVQVGGRLGEGLEALPAAWFPLGCCLFGMCLPVLLAAFGIAFGASGTTALAPVPFMAFKGLWGGLFGVVVCLIVLLRHLGKMSQ